MQNTFSQSGNDSKWFLKKSFFKIGMCHSRPPRDPPCFGRRTISFLVKFESSVLCTLLAYIGHLGYFIPHFMNKKADFGFKVLKKLTSKAEKMRKCPKIAVF